MHEHAQLFLDFAGEPVRTLVVGAAGGAVDDDDVRVGAEVDFAPAVAAHRDDGDGRGRLLHVVFTHLAGDGPAQRGVEDRVIYVGHAVEHFVNYIIYIIN